MGCLEGAQGLEVGPVAVGDFFLYPVASLESWVLDGISGLDVHMYVNVVL